MFVVLLQSLEAGAVTIAQDEESCIVFGMPKEATEWGAADSGGATFRHSLSNSPAWRRNWTMPGDRVT